MLNSIVYGDLLSDSLKSYLLETAVANEREGWINDQYSPGLMVINSDFAGKWIGHSGSQLGASAFVFTQPENRTTMAVMTNLGTFLSQQSQQMVFGELWSELTLLLSQ